MKLILASGSPRRKELLEKAGYSFEVVESNFEEYFDQNLAASDVAMQLALGKAQAVAKMNPEATVIGADTIVVLDGIQLGKPTSVENAKALLQSLSGRIHTVVTGVAIINKDKGTEYTAHDSATIVFKDFSVEFIDAYVATGTTMDLAGGYNIQHEILKPYIASIDGSTDTIIGLPMRIVAEFLDRA